MYLSDVAGSGAPQNVSHVSRYFACRKHKKTKLALSRTVQKHDMPSMFLLYSLYENLAKNPALRTKYNDFSESRCIVLFVIPTLILPVRTSSKQWKYPSDRFDRDTTSRKLRLISYLEPRLGRYLPWQAQRLGKAAKP